jgi:hypothetical protein
VTFRVKPEVMKLLQRLAERHYRTLSQQCEMIVTEYLKANGHLEEIQEKKPPKE